MTFLDYIPTILGGLATLILLKEGYFKEGALCLGGTLLYTSDAVTRKDNFVDRRIENRVNEALFGDQIEAMRLKQEERASGKQKDGTLVERIKYNI
jgi:hypothetical protein